jgi:hypothetical protein
LKDPPAGLKDVLSPIRQQFDTIFRGDPRTRILIDELTAYRTTDEAAARSVLQRFRSRGVLQSKNGGMDYAVYKVEDCLETGDPPATVVLELLLSSYICYSNHEYGDEVSLVLNDFRSQREPDTEPLLARLVDVAHLIAPEDAYRLCLEGALACRSLRPPSRMLLIQLIEALLLRWPADEELLSMYLIVCLRAAEAPRALALLLRNAALVRHTKHSLTHHYAAEILDDAQCAEAVLNADILEFMRYYRSLGWQWRNPHAERTETHEQ